MNENQYAPDWLKMLVAWAGYTLGAATRWVGDTVGALTLGEWVLVATLVYTIINIYVLFRDKIIQRRSHTRRSNDPPPTTI